MARQPPTYETPEGTVCPDCEDPCTIIPLMNDVGCYIGGRDATHYPPDWGLPVTDCCEAEIDAIPK